MNISSTMTVMVALYRIRIFSSLRAGKGAIARAADEYRKSILQIIDDQPTAFDKEKVIEEIKRERDVAQECNQYSAISAHELDIVIVEEGGIE